MRKRNRGFTLMEMLVAVAVFAVMSVLAYSGMDNVFNSSRHIDKKTDELQQLQLAFSRLKNDLELSMERTVRGRLGSRLHAFESKPDADFRQLSITTHVGSPWQWQQSVSSLQRVEYLLQENKLIRLVWPVLDRAYDSEPDKTILLENVNDIEYEFINKYAHEYWPLPKGNEDYAVLPRAVRMKVLFDADRELERVFLVRNL